MNISFIELATILTAVVGLYYIATSLYQWGLISYLRLPSTIWKIEHRSTLPVVMALLLVCIIMTFVLHFYLMSVPKWAQVLTNFIITLLFWILFFRAFLNFNRIPYSLWAIILLSVMTLTANEALNSQSYADSLIDLAAEVDSIAGSKRKLFSYVETIEITDDLSPIILAGKYIKGSKERFEIAINRVNKSLELLETIADQRIEMLLTTDIDERTNLPLWGNGPEKHPLRIYNWAYEEMNRSIKDYQVSLINLTNLNIIVILFGLIFSVLPMALVAGKVAGYIHLRTCPMAKVISDSNQKYLLFLTSDWIILIDDLTRTSTRHFFRGEYVNNIIVKHPRISSWQLLTEITLVFMGRSVEKG